MSGKGVTLAALNKGKYFEVTIRPEGLTDSGCWPWKPCAAATYVIPAKHYHFVLKSLAWAASEGSKKAKEEKS